MESSFLAVEFHGNERIELAERPGVRPGRNELLLAPLAVGICGTDVEIYEGTMGYYRSGLAKYPVVPGHEWVADVVDVGEDVDGFERGDRVVGECSIGCRRCLDCQDGRYHLCPSRTETGILNRDGAMAERMVFPAVAAFRVPRDLAPAKAALVEPTAVALNTARRSPARGRTVLVIGAGPIGILAAQCARVSGAAAVLIGDPVVERRAAAQGSGLDHVFPLGNGVAEDARCLRDVAGNNGMDVVLVCAGAQEALDLAIEVVRPGGDVVIPALFGRSNVEVDIDRLVVRDVRLHGVLGSPNCWPEAIALIATGDVVTDSMVTAPLSFEEVPAAMGKLRRRASGTVKVLIDPTKGRS